MNFSERIKQLCKERGLMMKDLAAKLEITPTGLSKAIGQSYPQLQTLERIAGALGVGMAELFAPAADQIVTKCPKCGAVLKINAEDGDAK